MAITKLRFHDKLSNWTLNEVSFSDFNLLVGVSGVGKTKIINTINAICSAAKGESSQVRGCDWEIHVSCDEGNYIWFGQTWPPGSSSSEINGFSDFSANISAKFYREEIFKDGKPIVRRYHEFRFLDTTLPALNDNDSAIILLKDTEEIAPLYQALAKIVKSEAADYNSGVGDDLETFPSQIAEKWLTHFKDLGKLKEAPNMPIVLKAYLLQQNFSPESDRLKRLYSDIFPTVIDYKIDRIESVDADFTKRHPNLADHLALAIKEKDVPGWLLGGRLSSGMIKTMIQIFEADLSEDGSTLLIDEIENSLGLNCLSDVVDYLLGKSTLQLIITSHHPYIINNVPMKYWKLVTRKGSEVTVKDTSSIRGLDKNSLLSGFVQLTNLEEYEEAIQ